MGNLGECAGHMIGRGDDYQRMKTVLDRPASGFHRVAKRVDGGIIEIDTAIEELVVTYCLAGYIGDGRAGIDAAD